MPQQREPTAPVQAGSNPKHGQPLNRRRALRVLSALAAAAAGAVALSASQPEQVSAANPSTIFTSSDAGTPAMEGANNAGGMGALGTTTGGPLAAGVKGASTGANSQGVWGVSNGSSGLSGSF